MKLKSPFLIEPHSKVRLARLETGAHPDVLDESAAEALMAVHREELDKQQELFYASQAKALLIIFQGMDTAGKDGAIRHIFSGVNPQGCQVASFKVPTPLELRHEFLWRCQVQTPPRGLIGIFNRSHYEDVLAPRVHGGVTAKQARERMDDINRWEKNLADNNVVVLKFFLHISREEQTRRLQARIDDPDKHWKLSPADFHERLFWDAYQEAYEDILRHTSHKYAPWFVIPSDHKWFRNVAISQVLIDCMKGLKLSYPAPTFDPSGLKLAKLPVAAAAKKAAARTNKGAIDPEHDSVKTGRHGPVTS